MLKRQKNLNLLVLIIILGLNFFFLFSGEILSGILSATMKLEGQDFWERVWGSFRPTVVILWVFMSTLVALLVFRVLKPLRKDFSGENYAKARMASVKLPTALVFIQNIGWGLGVFVYLGYRYLVYGEGAESGHDLWWIFHLKLSAGFMAGVFSNIIINNMILPLKEKLNMYDIRAGEKDFFLRNREMINVIGIIYLLGAYLSFIAFTYTQYDFGGMDFDPFQVVLGTIGFLGLLIILQVYLSTISNRTQLNKLSHGLESLLLKQSDGEQQIQLLNFDQTGGVISLFNKVLQKSQKEAKILGLIQDELLDNLSKIQIATGNMNDIVVQQQKNTQKVNAEKFQLEESMANLEEILHRQNETLEVALTHTHDIASAGRKTLLENENLRRNTQESHQKAEKQIAGSQMRMEKTKELSSRVMGITAQMDEAKLKSAKVNGILAEIEEVAEKTHVLAINASIESAHSGTYGKGFAIIAGEVRKVAEGTAEAVRQTAGILNEMQQAVGEASDFAQEVHDMVQETRDDSQAVQLTLGELSRVFQQNNQGIQGIAELTNSQNEISKKLEEKMDGLGNMSQETAKALRRQTMSKDRLDIVIDELDQSTEDGVKQNTVISRVIEKLSELRLKLMDLNTAELEDI